MSSNSAPPMDPGHRRFENHARARMYTKRIQATARYMLMNIYVHEIYITTKVSDDGTLMPFFPLSIEPCG
jgi:hypothetical protein